MTRFRSSSLALLLTSLSWAQARPALAQRPTATLVDTAVLRAPLLSESSGIVESRRRPGVFWTINDSGNRPLLFATDSTGADLGYVRVTGARNQDWEDVSVGPCTRTSGICLFIADTGDNSARRASVQIYVIPEPDPPTGPADTARTVAVEDVLELRYPDGAHDAEAIAVISGWLLLVTKDRSGPAVLFRVRLGGQPGRVLERVAPLAMRTSLVRGRIVTGAAVSRDERFLAIRTYPSIHLFELRDGRPVALTDENGITIPVVEAQGEGVAFDAIGRLILSSERADTDHAILTRLRLTGIPAP